MNIWTHLIGSVLFIFLLYLTFAIPISPRFGQTKVVELCDLVREEFNEMVHGSDSVVPRWPITIFVLCAIFCLSGSTIFHSFLCCSQRVRTILQTIDYCGISILISGSYFPVIYYPFYNYSQELKITSDNPELINKTYLAVPSLIQKGITIQAYPPEYYYSNLNKKKAELLSAATADAKVRAQGMLKATNNRVGKISSLKMGVMQITPADSNEVSDWGINDSSTIDKKITAVANVVFSVK